MKYLTVDLIKKLFGKRECKESKLVEEVDGFKEWQDQYKKLDIHFEIASNIFKSPLYSLHRYDYSINVHRDLHPELNEGIKSLPQVIEINTRSIEVLHPLAYEDAKKMATELVKITGEKVSLKTKYRRDNL